MITIPLHIMCLVFIKCNYKKFVDIATSFNLFCNDYNCSGNCLEPQGVSQILQKTPRARLLTNLKVDHSYKLVVKFQTHKLVSDFKTTGEWF